MAFALERVLVPSALKRNVFQMLLISVKRNLARAIALKRDHTKVHSQIQKNIVVSGNNISFAVKLSYIFFMMVNKSVVNRLHRLEEQFHL